MHVITLDPERVRSPGGKNGWFRAFCSCGEYENIGPNEVTVRVPAHAHARAKNHFEMKGDSNGMARFIEHVRAHRQQMYVNRVAEAEHLENLDGIGSYTCAEDGFIFYDGPGYLKHETERHPLPTVARTIEDIVTSANHVERELISARSRRFPRLGAVTSVRWIIDGRVLFVDDRGATSTVDLDDLLPYVDGWEAS